MKKLLPLLLVLMATPAMAAEFIGSATCAVAGPCSDDDEIKTFAMAAAANSLSCANAARWHLCDAEEGVTYEIHITTVNGGFTHYIWKGKATQVASHPIAWVGQNLSAGGATNYNCVNHP